MENEIYNNLLLDLSNKYLDDIDLSKLSKNDIISLIDKDKAHWSTTPNCFCLSNRNY